MESFKEKLPIIIAVIIAIAICAGLYYMLFYEESIYYTQIDNSRVQSAVSNDNMKFEYTLDCYDEKGKKKELKFKTSRELKEGAYLKLELMMTRGVKSWEEVQLEDMPDKVKVQYIK